MAFKGVQILHQSPIFLVFSLIFFLGVCSNGLDSFPITTVYYFSPVYSTLTFRHNAKPVNYNHQKTQKKKKEMITLSQNEKTGSDLTSPP